MSDNNEVSSNGYVMANSLIIQAINAAVAGGARVDEILAALLVQAEITKMDTLNAVIGQRSVKEAEDE